MEIENTTFNIEYEEQHPLPFFCCVFVDPYVVVLMGIGISTSMAPLYLFRHIHMEPRFHQRIGKMDGSCDDHHMCGA